MANITVVLPRNLDELEWMDDVTNSLSRYLLFRYMRIDGWDADTVDPMFFQRGNTGFYLMPIILRAMTGANLGEGHYRRRADGFTLIEGNIVALDHPVGATNYIFTDTDTDMAGFRLLNPSTLHPATGIMLTETGGPNASGVDIRAHGEIEVVFLDE